MMGVWTTVIEDGKVELWVEMRWNEAGRRPPGVAHLVVVSFDNINVGGNGAQILVGLLVAYVSGAQDLLYFAGD